MRPHRARAINVQNFMSASDQPIGDQHAVAAEVHVFGAHVRSGGLFGERNHFGDGLLELRREHVVGIVSETVIAQRDVGRNIENRFAISAKRLHPDVANSGRGKRLLERVAIELWQATRHRKGANIHKGSDLMSVERVDQFAERPSGMSDGVKSGQRIFDAGKRLCDAPQRISDEAILFRKDGAQINQNSSFFDASDNWRIRRAQPAGKFVCAQTLAG